MAETYNPNEVAKVKHLISLAESIAEKIDGGGSSGGTVDTRQTPTLTLDVTPSAAAINTSGGQQFNVTYTGDGLWAVYLIGSGLIGYGLKVSLDANLAAVGFTVSRFAEVDSVNIPAGTKIVVFAEGTDNYKPLTVEFEVQA